MKKVIVTITILLALCTVLTGCVKLNSTLTVNSDGSGDLSVIYGISKQLAAMQPDISSNLQDTKKSTEKAGYTVSDYNDTKYIGVQFKKHFTDLRNLKQFPNNDKVQFNVKENKGFFKNTYNVTGSFDLTGLTDTSSNDMEKSFAAAAMSQMDLSFHLNLPVAAGENNASKVTNNNKSLEWTLVANQKNDLKVQFSTVNILNVGLLIGVIAIIVILFVLFIIRKKKNHKDINAA